MNISHVVYKTCDLHGGIFNIRDQVPNFNDGLIPLLFLQFKFWSKYQTKIKKHM